MLYFSVIYGAYVGSGCVLADDLEVDNPITVEKTP